MKYDLAVLIYTQSGQKIGGYLTAEPKECTLEEATKLRDQIQTQLPQMTMVTVFTRDANALFRSNAIGHEPTEVTLLEQTLANSAIAMQIVQVS